MDCSSTALQSLQALHVFEGQHLDGAIRTASVQDVLELAAELDEGGRALEPECQQLVIVVKSPHAHSAV